MLKQETMNYIIEKMRGDSLTPLGIGSRVVGKDITTADFYIEGIQRYIKYDSKTIAMRSLSNHLSKDKNYTVSYGKWELVVDSTKFFNKGFYYKTTLADGIKLYLFYLSYNTYSTRIEIDLRIGCALTNKATSALNDTEILRECGDTLYSVDAYLRKVFGIKTFSDDYAKYNK